MVNMFKILYVNFENKISTQNSFLFIFFAVNTALQSSSNHTEIILTMEPLN